MSQVKLYKDRNFQIICLVTLMAAVGVSSITPAFPKIVEELHISETEVGMLIVAFFLPGMVLAPFLGVLADRFGRKRLLVPSLFLFGLAGGACALSRDFNTLVALRVLQGAGEVGLWSLSFTILGDLFSGRSRAEAMGLNISILSTGFAFYPIIGGALALFAWNYPFLLPLAAIPIGFFALFSLHSPEPRNGQSLREYLGSAWSYLKNIKVVSVFIAQIMVYMILNGAYLLYFSLFLGISFRLSPFVIGVILASSPLSTALVSSQLGRIVRIMSEGSLIKLGFVICTIALAMVPFMPRLELLLIPTIIFGAGLGLVMPCLQSYIAGLAPFEYRAAIMSINSTMVRVGSTLGPLIFGLAYVYAGLNGVFFFAAGLTLATAIVGVIGGKIIRLQTTN